MTCRRSYNILTASNLNLAPESISGPLFNLFPHRSPTCPIQSSMLTHTNRAYFLPGIHTHGLWSSLIPAHMVWFHFFEMSRIGRCIERKQLGGRRIAHLAHRRYSLNSCELPGWIKPFSHFLPTLFWSLCHLPETRSSGRRRCSYKVIWRKALFLQQAKQQGRWKQPKSPSMDE